MILPELKRFVAGHQAQRPKINLLRNRLQRTGTGCRARHTEVERLPHAWLSIRVELIEGHGESLWPRPGRIFAAARTHTFEQLADAIDDSFARWDRSHLHEFTLADSTRLMGPEEEWGSDGERMDDIRRVKLSRLQPEEQFVYVFDVGDDWTHLCTVARQRVDPAETLGIMPFKPLPYWGWGDIPDQYRRRWDGDDGESPQPLDPQLTDLPRLRAQWGPPASRLRG